VQNSEFKFSDVKDKVFNSLEYIGRLQYNLENQKDKIEKIIRTIKESERNIRVAGFRFTADIGEMAAMRMNHKIYENGKREASFINLSEFPEIKPGDIVIPLSGEGETHVTNWITKQFVGLGNKAFPLTYRKKSALTKLVGEENSIIFPPTKKYKLSKTYEIREYEIGLMITLDSIALSLERSEQEMERTHSVFG
jgi:D-arabinose 5-phosphate isomerase GutQ